MSVISALSLSSILMLAGGFLTGRRGFTRTKSTFFFLLYSIPAAEILHWSHIHIVTTENSWTLLEAVSMLIVYSIGEVIGEIRRG